jgi:catechol 2,3-dioxygenase-like lactoylglutathione lyase family enzyme
MIDHFNLPVSELQRSRRFYESVLGTLGFRFLVQDGDAVGFGADSWGFGLVVTPSPIPRLHVAFKAQSRHAVDAFFRAALTAGATRNGDPGLRSQYDADYYAAYVLDLDGHNIEAVCRRGVV